MIMQALQAFLIAQTMIKTSFQAEERENDWTKD